MSDDVDLCPVCGRPAPADGSACPTRGCPYAETPPVSRETSRPTPAHDRIGHPEPQRPEREL